MRGEGYHQPTGDSLRPLMFPDDRNECPAYPVLPWQTEQEIGELQAAMRPSLPDEARSLLLGQAALHDPEFSQHPDDVFLPRHPRREKPADVSLEDVPLLNSKDQYISELWKVQRLEPVEEDRVVAQARNGDQQAKHTLVESCLGYVLYMARVYSVYVEHDDLLDIVQVGNLAITEKVDQALEKAESVGAYLCGVAKQSIMQYCLYHSRLMPVKDHKLPISEFPQATSLEAFREQNRDILSQQSTETDQEQRKRLREALSQLTDKQREVIELRYGFGDTRLQRIRAIAELLGEHPKAITALYFRACKRLRELLLTPEGLTHQTG